MKRRGLVLSAVLAGALMTTACAAQTGTGTAAAGDVQQKVVNVTASETVTAEPDIAEFEMTVYSQATDAKTCQTQNSTDLEKAVEALKSQLLPLAAVLTPNIPEAEVLSGLTISGSEDMERAAREIGERYGCAVLCKGGHDLNDANDLLWQDGSCKWFCGRRIHNPNTHGTGCTLSSAIASNLAKGCDLETAVERAKIYLSGALSSMLDLGAGSGPLDHLFSIPELDLDRIRSLQSPAGGR